MKHSVFGCDVMAVVLVVSVFVGAQSSAVPQRAVPLEPTAAILDAFRTHDVVALGDNEGSEQGHAFRTALVRDPRFAAMVNDIVVEFGNARYQDLMDRFVLGEDVPYECLRRVWQDTTQVEYTWDLPIYEEFFHAVRDVNTSLPPQSKLRVLLGDPPIEWEHVHTLEDLERWLNRDAHASELVRREVLAKGHRALVIYGDQHLVRRANPPGASDERAGGLVAQLESSGAKVFSVHTETRQDLAAIRADVASWPKPSLAILGGTTLGMAPLDPRRPVPMADQFDAVLYFGSPASMTTAKLSRALCSDHDYLAMRIGRLALVPPPPGAPFAPVEELKQYCALAEAGTPIADTDPKTTTMILDTLTDAALGKVDLTRIEPKSRDRLVPFLQTSGPRFLAPNGSLQSLTLLAENSDGGKRTRRYRAIFASGRKIIVSIGVSPTGTLLSIDPRPE
ncbi:MAG TPA: hypothetical protein VNB49_17890 [Candidatus Dormibacteraeota bacterium]|nr:hypothetical protein [Candidatus Dormibacteraeota bacterium]